MNIVVGDLLTVGGHKYMTLGILSYENKQYAFVNKLTSEEDVTQDFYIFEDLGGSIKIVMDGNLKKILLPMFEKILMKEIEKIN